MKVLTIAAFNRPNYLEAVLAKLALCESIKGYDIFASVDGKGSKSDKSEQLLKDFTAAEKVVVSRPNKNLGCTHNLLSCLERGFQESDFIIHLEDDVVPAVDFLLWMEWAREAHQDNDKVFNINAYTPQNNGNDNQFYARTWRTSFLGLGMWKDRYQLIKDTIEPCPIIAWDSKIREVFPEHVEVAPCMSRVQHIGEYGLHVPGPEWNKKNHFVKDWIGDTEYVPVDKYVLQK